MRKRYVIAIIVVLALVQPSLAAKKRVLIDLNHDEKILQGQPCFDIFQESYDFHQTAEKTIYNNLQDYDVLIIGMPQISFDSAETEAVARFISNGGGLLLIAEPQQDVRGVRSQYINSLSVSFGVEFSDAMILKDYGKTEIQSEIHPLLNGVSEINWAATVYLSVTEPSKVLLHHGGKCLAAYCEYGKGRIIFLSDSDIFTHQWVYKSDNKQFVSNIFDWLAEPGGPYFQQNEFLNVGRTLMEKGEELMESGDFPFAESVFGQSKSYLENALDIYENDSTRDLISSINSLIADAETGVEAKNLYEEGKNLYELGEYASAIIKLEKAKHLFESIDCEAEECALLIAECKTKIGSESRQEIAEVLLSDGIAHFRHQEYDRAKSKFEEALSLFTEMQDEGKIQECNQWIASCEDSSASSKSSWTNLGLMAGVVAALLLLVIGVHVLRARVRKPEEVRNLEREKKKLDEMLQNGLISEKEYNIAVKGIEGQLRKLKQSKKGGYS